MKARLRPPVFDRDEYYESTSRAIRWVCLGLVFITFPLSGSRGLIVATLLVLTAIYNGLRYSRRVLKTQVFSSRVNTLAVDHIFVLTLIAVSGGLSSPYYPLFFLLIIATIASYGIAGFAFSLSAQLIITPLLLAFRSPTLPSVANSQLTVKLVLLIVFSLVAEQSVRSRDEEYLLSSRFTHRIENERSRLLALINSLSVAVLAVDGDGKIYLYNATALELLNTNRDITGLRLGELLPLHDKSGRSVKLLPLVEQAGHPISRQDLSYAPGDGSDMILDITVSPVQTFGFGKENGGYMAVFRDITKQKTLDQERDEFIAVTSHELRTPLAIAEANLSTAMLPGFAHMEPKALELLTQAHNNILFLSQLIQDLTTLSRAERGDLQVDFSLVDAARLGDQLARDYRAQAEAKRLKLTLNLGENLGNLFTSEPELHEILQNFLTNAIKYTASGGITITVTRHEKGTEFAIRDTGIGISASDKTKIFTKFYRSEDYRTRQTNGTGLGLYITHKLAEKLGLTISFTSRLNRGSTFTVLVPNHTEPPAPAN